jgi:hypothetical protein
MYVDINPFAVFGRKLCWERSSARQVNGITLVFVLGTARREMAQDAKVPYPSMAPIDQYLIEDRNSEVALAQNAAPESISRDAEVMVLGRYGYETAIPLRAGFAYSEWRAPRPELDKVSTLEQSS